MKRTEHNNAPAGSSPSDLVGAELASARWGTVRVFPDRPRDSDKGAGKLLPYELLPPHSQAAVGRG